jgi:hypothetical protein
MATTLATKKQEIYDYVHTLLGGGMVDVELDPIHYETAYGKSLNRYRQRTENSVEESYITISLQENVNEYTLPDEIIEVRQIFRRSVGSRLGGTAEGGSLFEPFNLAYTNTYLLAGSGIGGLATYNFFAQQQELIGRMFGSFIEFTWNPSTHKLTILQRPRADEEVLLFAYNYRPDFELLKDYKANQWIKDYSLASCKYMLGEARSKFSTIAGPGGGTTLNGDSLKAEAQAEIEKLDNELATAIAGGTGYGFVIG